MAVPALIDRETFDAVQAPLKPRQPMVMPARVTSGPTLLTGICFCAKRGGAVTLRTGKGSAGGTYRYYTCSTKARQGKTAAKVARSRWIDSTIWSSAILRAACFSLSGWRPSSPAFSTAARSALSAAATLAELNKRIAETDQRLNRLYDAIESGLADLNDNALKERIAGLKAIRDQTKADAERAQTALDHAGNQAVSPDMVKTFARVAHQRIRLKNGGYRRDHLRALAQRVEVADKEVRIIGSKSVAASSGKSAAFGVHSSVLKWRAREDSNCSPSPSERPRSGA
jgi:site-specific DNA recombinase